jgi:hypothetical protein
VFREHRSDLRSFLFRTALNEKKNNSSRHLGVFEEFFLHKTCLFLSLHQRNAIKRLNFFYNFQCHDTKSDFDPPSWIDPASAFLARISQNMSSGHVVVNIQTHC